MNAVNKSYNAKLYIGDIVLENCIMFNNVVFTGLPEIEDENETGVIAKTGEMMLGMDILSLCDMSIVNRNGHTELSITRCIT